MNVVVLSVLLMLSLTLMRLNIIISLVVASLIGGLMAGLDLDASWNAFQNGLGASSKLALSYALIGGFAYMVSASGVVDALASRITGKLHKGQEKVRFTLITLITLMAVSSQNILPVHVAFIPLLIPPLLALFNHLNMDRRLIACLLSFGLVTPYMFLPVGFGQMFLNELIIPQIEAQGPPAAHLNMTAIMALPALGMLVGLLTAIFVSYRKPRSYQYQPAAVNVAQASDAPNAPVFEPYLAALFVVAAVVFLVVQLSMNSMAMGAIAGFLVVMLGRGFKWGQGNDMFTEGMKVMATIGIIMMAAAGFAEVMKQSGEIPSLVQSAVDLFDGIPALAALAMLLVGLLITIGIGSSFATVPLLAVIFVPVGLQLGFSIEVIACLLATAAVLGDTGSPASEVTLATTAGLNIDGQHDHIRDTVIPTMLHYNVPLLAFGWLAVFVL
jgi:predicted histidine transporter YuiF (NhaC family)